MRIIITLIGLFVISACFGKNNMDSIPSCRLNFQVSGLSGGFLQNMADGEKSRHAVTVQEALSGRIGCGIVTAQPAKKDTANPKIVIRCGITIRPGNEPLFVIDGIPVESKELANLNVNDIERIDILKNAAASAIFGCRASNGVITITTKQERIRTFIIKDFLDGSPVHGATVSFISADKKDTLMLLSNERGMVVNDKLKQGVEYTIQVTSVGYKLFTTSQTGKGHQPRKELLLERNEGVCQEVVLRSTQCHRVCRVKCICRVKGIKPDTLIAVAKIAESETGYKIYPNPVLKGGVTTIEVESETASAFHFQVLSLDGRIMMSQSQKALKGINRFSIVMDSRWASGTYIVQLMYEEGKPAVARKIVVK